MARKEAKRGETGSDHTTTDLVSICKAVEAIERV